MRRYQNTFFAISVGLLTIVGTFAFHRVLEPNRVCLAWEGVRELSFQKQSIPACEAVSRLQRPLSQENIRRWTNRINSLDRLSWLKETSKTVSIRIDEKYPESFNVENQLVTIGIHLAEKPGQLEHATLLGWIKINFPEHSDSTQDVMADLLTWLTVGEGTFPTEKIRYSLTPFSHQNYCESPFRSLQDLQTCEFPKSQISAANALRPVVSWTIWSFVKDLASSKQIEFFKSLLNSHFEDIASLEGAAHLNHQEWAKEKIFFLLKKWSLADQLERREMTRALNKTDLNEPLAFDLTVEVNGPQLEDRVKESIKKWSKFYPRVHVLFVSHEKKIVFPEGVAVDFKKADLETRHYVMLTCGWPSPKETFSPKNHAFSAYQICADDPLPSWTEIMSSRLARF